MKIEIDIEKVKDEEMRIGRAIEYILVLKEKFYHLNSLFKH